MHEIFEQGGGSGIGLSTENFVRRLGQKCESLDGNCFVFILYDFNDKKYKRMLKEKSVFVELDRLSGEDLHVFFLHSKSRTFTWNFNRQVLVRLGLNEQPSMPCVIFFRSKNKNIYDIQAIELDGSGDYLMFNELYKTLESLKNRKTTVKEAKNSNSVSKIAFDELIRIIVKGVAKMTGISV